MADAHIETAAIADIDSGAALNACARYGKGRGHPAQLNMGDCFAYALAKNRGIALLFKGRDSTRTDIAQAVTLQ
jgi:ribonuclease VapC